MPQFVFTYRSPTGYTPNGEKVQAWWDWFNSMGDQLVELGKPVFDRGVIGNTSRESTELGGYSIISADDLESAMTIAKGCPQLDNGGGVEVGLLGEVHPPEDAS